MGSNYTRIIISLGLLVGIFIIPWYFLAILFFLTFIKISNFYEGLVLALFYDIFYVVDRTLFGGLPIFFIVAGLIFIGCKLIKKELRV
ncbi:MAG: hypothetical protein KAJ58_01360 [Candidatus Pacebacteria bacterium]|nr:hypothetical protein [Candidatus Paceibacterota bacterium]